MREFSSFRDPSSVAFGQFFEIVRQSRVKGSERTLYLMRAKGV